MYEESQERSMYLLLRFIEFMSFQLRLCQQEILATKRILTSNDDDDSAETDGSCGQGM